MTTFLLIRHATTGAIGKLITGRAPGVHLNDCGVDEATHLAAYLSQTKIHAIYSSPRERCRETAEPLGRSLALPVITCDALDELEYGAWSGCSLNELESLNEWRRFNTLRSITQVPSGELILEIQTRMVKLLETLRRKHAREVLALVTHAEVIRASVAHYLGIPIDLAYRLEIGPASICTICSDESDIWILGVNQQPLYPLQVTI